MREVPTGHDGDKPPGRLSRKLLVQSGSASPQLSVNSHEPSAAPNRSRAVWATGGLIYQMIIDHQNADCPACGEHAEPFSLRQLRRANETVARNQRVSATTVSEEEFSGGGLGDRSALVGLAPIAVWISSRTARRKSLMPAGTSSRPASHRRGPCTGLRGASRVGRRGRAGPAA